MVESFGYPQYHLHATVLALESPRSSWRTVWSRTSKALGIFKPTKVLRMRSRTDETISRAAFWLVSLAGQAPADRLVEVERARGDDITGAKDQDWRDGDLRSAPSCDDREPPGAGCSPPARDGRLTTRFRVASGTL